MKPNNYTPSGSLLTFIRQTVTPQRGSLGNKKGESRAMALYECKCGKHIEACMYSVKSGSKKSCGCLRSRASLKNTQNIKHNLSKHPLYKVFYGMRLRCYNKNSNGYSGYGAKGVIICKEWLNNIELFIKWALDNGWKKGLQIDKDIIPKKLGIPVLLYSPEMCSIVTSKENNYCKGVKMYEFNGEVKSLFDWSVELRIDRSKLQKRLKTMPINIAFKTIVRKPKKEKVFKLSKKLRLITYKNKTQSLIQWCRELKITPMTYYGREKTGNTSLDYLLAPNKRPTVSEKLKKSIK